MISNAVINGEKRDIYISGNKIEKISGCGDPYPANEKKIEGDCHCSHEPFTVLDAEGMTAIPSFANMHTHAAMTMFRGTCEDMSLNDWLNKVWKMESRLDDDIIYCGVKLACLEMIKSGTLCFKDQYWRLGPTVRAVSEMGLRADLDYPLLDQNDESKDDGLFSKACEYYDSSLSWPETIRFSIGIHSPYSVSLNLMKKGAAFAREHSLLINIHLAETRKEIADSITLHGKTPAAYLSEAGILGPDVIAAHCLWLNDDDISILGKHGVSAVHNINSNMKLGSGYEFRYDEMCDAGITVCLGTDGCASSNNLDMLETMKTSALMQKAWRMDPKALPLGDLFNLATRNGYKVLGLDGGRIEEGALADILLINTDGYAFTPHYNFLSNLIYSAHSDCVDTAICNGRVIMRHRKVEGEKEILEDAEREYVKLLD
jgi:5-methylthioadenosine/S-adenosylhomocysteine deaminase